MNKLLTHTVKSLLRNRNYNLCRRDMAHAGPSTASRSDPANRMVWLDMELTGLDFEKDVILEVACVITESNLDIIARNEMIIYQPEHVLKAMNDWCQVHHRKSGLIEECQKSKLTIEEVDDLLYEFVKTHTPAGTCCLAGNSVYYDRWYAVKFLPKFNSHLHYRIVDVSSIKELSRRWNRVAYKDRPQKQFVHRALDDILESIEELKYYKEQLFDK